MSSGRLAFARRHQAYGAVSPSGCLDAERVLYEAVRPSNVVDSINFGQVSVDSVDMRILVIVYESFALAIAHRCLRP